MWDAMVKKDQACCEGGIYYAFSDMNMYFDDRDFDAVIGGNTTLAVDANSFIFWNSVRSTPIPTRIDSNGDGERWTWTIADPELTYFKDGALVPVTYEVEMQKSCVNRDALDYLRYSYKFYLRLVGGFAFSPLGQQGESGVLKFQKA
jgi:hypothetical protein